MVREFLSHFIAWGQVVVDFLPEASFDQQPRRCVSFEVESLQHGQFISFNVQREQVDCRIPWRSSRAESCVAGTCRSCDPIPWTSQTRCRCDSSSASDFIAPRPSDIKLQ